MDIVFFHSPCNDGFGCSYIIWLYCTQHDMPLPEFIGLRPNDPAPIELCKGKNVVVTDLSWNRVDVLEMSKVSESLLILDHHKTAFDNLDGVFDDVDDNSTFIFGKDCAGINLTWDYYFTQEIPDFLRYIALRDIWQHKNNEFALAFTTGLDLLPNFLYLDRFRTDPTQIEQVTEVGRKLLLVREQQLIVIAKDVVEHEWEGYITSFINKGYPWTSDLGEYLCNQDTLKVAFMWTIDEEGLIRVSLRSNNKEGPDVEVIAKKYGGGGHSHAAGFVIIKGNVNWKKIEKYLVKLE